MFIVLAMSISKNFLSLHITGNDLPYYERIFMRSLIAARVGFAFKDTSIKDVQRNKERY
jgi:predicted ATP-grasp superfamily ATP-dependent carboligase